MNAQLNTGMQPVQFENPMGVDGFQFVEFAAPDAKLLHDNFKKMGFVAVAKHTTRAITVYRQGACDFLVNEEPNSFAADFAKQHGPSACGFAIRVSKPAEWACEQAVQNGGEKIEHKAATKAVAAPVIKGIGDCMLYLVDRYGADALRLYILFMGPAAQDKEWQDTGVEGMWRFLTRLWRVVNEQAVRPAVSAAPASSTS